ncbi:uncharacterized protein LOC128870369 [Anastrepha ludens]|uniref:uncharacterized protein LOC128870369 n=1 Tax=Anastrepha ludens TaxID=28586 RepID=UPI0023B04819|nr:uncharacterized protein LOC128870369 [Anastrepha ludens]
MTKLEKLEEQMKLQQQYLDNKYKILSQYNDLPSSSTSMASFSNGPTPGQLAARQAIPKQLPTFNGDPEEWPLFISSFDNSTTVAGYTDAENFIRLQASLKGKAREMVKCKLFLPSMVPEIIKTLRMCFGRPEHILERAMNKARAMPALKDKLEGLIEFALCVRNICATMEGCQMYMHLHNPLLVKELVDKLPNNQKLKWAVHPKDEKTPVVKQFSDWLYNLAEAASTVVSLAPAKSSATVNTHTIDVNTQHPSPARNIIYQGASSRKWEEVKANNLCRQCLNPHRRKCFMNKVCGVDGCTIKHNPLLHKTITVMSQQKPIAVSTNTNEFLDAQINTHSSSHEEMQPLFRIVPIRIYSKNKVLNIFAFLDEGSSVTLMEKRIFDELGLKGEQDPLCLRWTGNPTRVEENSVRAAIEISSVTNWQKYTLKNIHTVDDLNLPAQSINASAMERLYPYLAGLPIASYNNVKPSLLIGADNWRLAIPLKIREGTWFQPIASKTRLGWALQGCNSRQTAEYRLNIHTCDCQKRYDELHETVKEFFTLESSKPTQLLSEEDAKAVSIANNTCKKGDNFYEIGLPWRTSSVLLPNNYVYGLQRLMCLQRKFVKDPILKSNIQIQINNLLSKGYAKKLSPIEAAISNGKTWYLPIFIVSNPNKPGKLRMVWDAAAKVNGVSLNNFLLSGPDLLNPLVSILLAFRVGRVAICGDIAEMFHRINIRDSDMHAQRFLWCDDGDDPQQPSIYVMRALTFELNCAPFIAHYIRDKNADHFENELPRAVEAVKKNHYVDDFIDCGDDEQSALELAQQVKKIHGAAGFNIRGWSSNSKFVVEQLEEDPMSVQSVKEWGSTTKVLGMFWDPLSDNFKYICRFARLRRDVINESIIPTKREALQVLMSIFDPLGFVCCYTVGLKILLQDVWRSGLAWDDPLQDNLFDKWNQWKSTMPLITAAEIPRCYSLLLKDAEDVQLHTFVDAGESAYAAVCYLRVSKGNDVTVSLVAGKSKVAPLKPLSIPRLELQAAVIGVRLANMVSNTQRINIMSKYWWTDSKTVLRWMRMDPKNFHQFVMHRIGEILEASNVSQWRWVPSRNNPADLATKTTTRQCYQLWFTGPNFLKSSAEVWPQWEELSLEECDDSEIKHYVLHMKKEHMNNLMLNVEHFSSWKRLYRAVATFLFYVDRLRSVVLARQRKTSIDFDMIQKAQCLLIRYAQSIEYCEEIRCLKRGKNIDNSSKLFTINVYLDTDGIIRCKSRVEHLNNHEDIKVMPNSHHVTFLIVRWAHENFHHLMHESVINQIRGTYFINRLRVLYKRVRAECQKCKNRSSIPQPPQMAALPAARIAAFERPFTYVGIDYFGPLLVIVGRRREKRWGVLFTCLTLRAIHIEVAHSLNTSSCIMAIRNFISRRGYPREIFSDNGSNFKASEKIISESLKNIDLNGIASSFDRVKWRFNPPSAPHMGGAWERLVRSVKTVLYETLPSTSFSDESLRSALNEVEFILNARPLTSVSLENGDDEALTPNHLLIGSSDGYKPICSDTVDLRQRWQLTQQFADRFWHRWVKEYIPVISRRTKWFTKQRPVRIGDVVVIADQDLPRNCWPKGRIVDVVKAKDGQVRSARVETKSGILHRPIAKVAVLDVGT